MVGGEVRGCHTDGHAPQTTSATGAEKQGGMRPTPIPLGGRAIHSATASRPVFAPDRNAPPRRWS